MSDAKKTEMATELPSGVPAFANPLGKQERSRTTRRELMEAAREIFARDGFELARLEDIAAAAGKTRGAFYAHFRDKEDVFFAIFEEDIEGDYRRIRDALHNLRTGEDRLEALTYTLASLVNDRRRMLLSIEFKLYAVRRPQQQKRLADLHAAIKHRSAEANIFELIPEFAPLDPMKKRKQAAECGALIDGLALNRLFDPPALSEEQVLFLLRKGLDLVVNRAAETQVPLSPEAPLHAAD